MDEPRLERLESKLDRIAESVAAIDKTLAGQHVELKEHIRRTALLEEKLEPVEDHVAMVNGAMKLIVGLGVVVGVVLGILQLMGK